jgi:hypothetical protein
MGFDSDLAIVAISGLLSLSLSPFSAAPNNYGLSAASSWMATQSMGRDSHEPWAGCGMCAIQQDED